MVRKSYTNIQMSVEIRARCYFVTFKVIVLKIVSLVILRTVSHQQLHKHKDITGDLSISVYLVQA